jgi:DDE family transposase
VTFGRQLRRPDLPTAGARWGEAALPEGSVYRFLARERVRLFPAELFADLFQPTGPAHRSWPPRSVPCYSATTTTGRRASRPATGPTGPPVRSWWTHWSVMPTGPTTPCGTSRWTHGSPRRPGCWPPSPAKTSRRPTTGASGSSRHRPRPGHLHRRPRGPPRPQDHRARLRRLQGPCGGGPRQRGHLRGRGQPGGHRRRHGRAHAARRPAARPRRAAVHPGDGLWRQRLRHRRQPGLAGRPRAHPDGQDRTPDRTGRPLRRGGRARFSDACSVCPLRDGCTISAGGRMVTIHPHEGELAAARIRQRQPAWRADYRATRPKVERKLAHLLRRRHGAVCGCGASSASPKTGSCWPPRPTWPASPPSACAPQPAAGGCNGPDRAARPPLDDGCSTRRIPIARQKTAAT